MVLATGAVLIRNRSGGRLGFAVSRSVRFHLPPTSCLVWTLAGGPASRTLPNWSEGSGKTLSVHGPGGQLEQLAGCCSSHVREPPVHSRFMKSVIVIDPGFWTGPV